MPKNQSVRLTLYRCARLFTNVAVLLALVPATSGCWLGASELSDALEKGEGHASFAEGDGSSDPPEEKCNGVDDDGDGEVDEGLVTGSADIDLSSTLTAHADGEIPIAFDAIGAGCFQMGCTPEQIDCDDDEYPVHTVRLTRPFYMMRMEMAQGQFEALMGSSPSWFHGDNLPMDSLSWHMAAAAANALSAANGDLEKCYTCTGSDSTLNCEGPSDPYGCSGYRLPTEAEWEYAARCGEGTVFAGSSDPEKVAWISENSDSTTQPVGTLEANGCGLYDMSGNVFEWVGDWSGDYGEGLQLDPVGAGSGSNRIFRGGGYLYPEDIARNSNRDGNDPGVPYRSLGLRLVQTIP